MAGGRRDRGLYGGRNISRARMWLEVGEKEQRTEWCRQCVKSQDLVGGSRDGGLYGGGSVYGAGMWLEVGKTVDCMVEAVCK